MIDTSYAEGIIESSGMRLPSPEKLARTPFPIRAAMAELLLDPIREDVKMRRAENLLNAAERRRQGIPPEPPKPRNGPHGHDQGHAQVAQLLGISPSTLSAASRVRRNSQETFDRLLRGDFRTVAEAERAAERAAGADGGEGKTDRHTFTRHLQPLNRYLRDWKPESFRGMTPAEARRLLPQVRDAHFALIEIERALEERAIVTRALR